MRRRGTSYRSGARKSIAFPSCLSCHDLIAPSPDRMLCYETRTHLLGMDSELVELFLVSGPALGRVVGHEDDALSWECAKSAGAGESRIRRSKMEVLMA